MDNISNTTTIFIGECIQRELTNSGMTVTHFAKCIGVQRPNAYRIFQMHSIDTDLLMRISELLKHDFFLDYSNHFSSVQSPKK